MGRQAITLKNPRRQASRQESAERMESLAAIAGGVAHELNNLLSAVNMSLDLLPPEVGVRSPWLVQSLRECVHRGMDVARQLLWLARGVEEDAILFQPAYLVADVSRMAEVIFSPTVDVVSEYPRELSLLRGDPVLFYRVLLDLCLEARPALREGGTFTLRAHELVGGEAGPARIAGAQLVVEAESCPREKVRSLRRAAPLSLGKLVRAYGGSAERRHLATGGLLRRIVLPCAPPEPCS